LALAYAILADVLSYFLSKPLGLLNSGEAVILSDIWPREKEINECMSQAF
jgi:aconitate hydratase